MTSEIELRYRLEPVIVCPVIEITPTGSVTFQWTKDGTLTRYFDTFQNASSWGVDRQKEIDCVFAVYGLDLDDFRFWFCTRKNLGKWSVLRSQIEERFTIEEFEGGLAQRPRAEAEAWKP